MTYIEQMRAVLQSNGTAKLVRLTLGTAAYYKQAFVDKAINELEKRLQQCQVQLDELSTLERLAVEVLVESAGMREVIKRKPKASRRKASGS